MPLSKDDLKSNILSVYNDVMSGKISFSNPPNPAPPQMANELAAALADAYDKYAKNAQAGALTTIVTPGLKTGLQSFLNAPDYSGWGPGVAAYWAPVTFTGGGYIPANPMVQLPTLAVGISGEIQGYIQTSRDSIDKAAADLAQILHSWTVKLTVTAITTSTPPVTSIEMVS